MKIPNFFIVGAPKCGTTAMEMYLNQHPDVLIPIGIESHFFGTDLSFKTPRPTKEKYLSYFSGVKGEIKIGDCFVWSLYSKRASCEIKELCPSAKIIIMLRNPVDVLYSLHSQLLYNGDETIQNFEAALEAEKDRKKGLRIPFCYIPVEGLFYREVVRFTQQIQRYIENFGWENVKIIIFDDFRSDTPKIYKETLNFLDVNPAFQPKFEIINPNKVVHSKKLRDFLRNPPQFISKPTKILVPSMLRDKLIHLLARYNTKYVPRPPMNPELRRRLQAEFASEVEQLSELLGRDLTNWSKD